MKSKIKELIAKEIEAIQNIPIDGVVEKAVELIYTQVQINKGKVVVSGMGKAGQIGHNISTTLCSTGTPSVFIHPSEAQHGDMGLVQENDILILISNSGKTREIVEFDTLIKRVYPKIKVILITGSSDCVKFMQAHLESDDIPDSFGVKATAVNPIEIDGVKTFEIIQ